MSFTREVQIRFQHCDPAGIVFYPRYFEMINEVVEDWFDQVLGLSFQRMHVDQGLGVPTVHVECEFMNVSRIGEVLTFELRLLNIGRKSFRLEVLASISGEARLRAEVTLVCVRLGEQLLSVAIPPELRHKMSLLMGAA